MSSKPESEQAALNTDRELWRGPDEGSGDYYADSIHVTQSGGIGINCGGHVIVKPLREWHSLASAQSPLKPEREITPEIELAMARESDCRDHRDGKPFYCTFCGAGWNEYGACEDVRCELESEADALIRLIPSVTIPQIIGYNVGDYSDIMDEPL